jgi:hypothetical protein
MMKTGYVFEYEDAPDVYLEYIISWDTEENSLKLRSENDIIVDSLDIYLSKFTLYTDIFEEE